MTISFSRREAIGLTALIACVPRLAWSQSGGMVSRTIPHTGESLPVVGLGTPRIFDYEPDPARQAQMSDVISALIAGGGRMVDTANGYGRGEQRLGEIIEALGVREKLFVATKYSSLDTPEAQRESVKHSQRMLQMQKFDLLYAWGVRDANFDSGFLRELRQQGATRYIGVAAGRAPDSTALEQLMKRGQLDFLHYAYSIEQRDAEARLLPAARHAGVAVVATLPFGGSSLFGRVAGKPLPPWAGDLGVHSWAQFFLKFVLANPAIITAVPGTDKLANLNDDLQGGHSPIPDAKQRQRMLAYWQAL